MTETANEFDFTDLTLPQYVPINVHMIREFELATKLDTIIDLDNQMKQILNDCQNYVDFIFENDLISGDDTFFQSSYENYEKLAICKLKYKHLQNIISTCKTTVHQSITTDAALSLDTWNSFRTVQTPQFADLIQENIDSSPFDVAQYRTELKKDKQLQHIKAIPYIIRNPEEPIPDENDDEEINISGGKISLKDPISLQLFQNPVTSACGHTFEINVIEQQFDNNAVNCPISGCGRTIKRADLVVDHTMVLRAKAYLFAQKHNRNETEMPVLLL